MQTIAELKAVIGADIGGFQKGMTKVSESLGGVGKQLAQTGVALAGLGLAAGGAFLANGVVQAVEFEKSLKNIQAVTGASAADIAMLGKTLNEIGGQSVAGPQAVADAYYDIAGGVADASVRLATLNAAIAVSEAGNANLATTTKGMISIMNAYSFSAEQAGFVSDVFTQTVGKGVGTMDEFVSAMSPLGGLMSTAGIEFDNLGAMMAFMTTQGTSAAEAATQIKSATTAILKPNKAMQEAFKKMGVESGAAALKMYGLEGTLGRLKTAFGGSDQAMAEAMGSTEALQAAVALNNKGYEEFLGTFEDTMTGVTNAARAVQLQSVSAQFDLLKSQFSSIAIDVGSVLLPALNTILGGVNAFIQDVKTKGLGTALREWFEKGVAWLRDSGGPLLQEALTKAIQFTSDVVTWIKTNAPSLAAGFILWLSDSVINLAKTVGPLVGEAIKKAVTFASDIGAWFNANAPDLAYGFGVWLTKGLNWLVLEAPGQLAQAIQMLFSGTTINGDSIVAAFTSIFGPDGPLFALFDGIFGLEKGTLGLMFTDFFGENGPVQTAVRGIVEPIQKVWDDLFGENGGLKKTVDTLKGLVEGIFTKMREAIVNILKGILSPLKTLLQGIYLVLHAVGDEANAQKALEAIQAIEGFKATGGAMAANKAYVVGEKGPEIVMPQRSSTVIPNNRMAAGGGTMVLNGPMYFQGVNDVVTLHDQLESEKRRRNR